MDVIYISKNAPASDHHAATRRPRPPTALTQQPPPPTRRNPSGTPELAKKSGPGTPHPDTLGPSRIPSSPEINDAKAHDRAASGRASRRVRSPRQLPHSLVEGLGGRVNGLRRKGR